MGGNVVTLTGAEADTVVAVAASALAERGAAVGAPDWLAAGAACDLPFSGLALEDADRTVRAAAAGAAVDVVVQAAEGRRKRLLVADMESTIIENEMLDELADFLGLREEVAEITRKAMNDELDFTAALEARVALLRGMERAVLDKAAERIQLMPGARTLVATMRAHGATAALVSGGFTVFARPIAEALGFDRVVANELAVEGGVLSGEVRPPIVTRETKLATLQSLAAELGLGLAATLAVGDGANDLPMIEAAGLGVAFRAKPAVAAKARVRIEHGDLTALLWAQGYRAAELREG